MGSQYRLERTAASHPVLRRPPGDPDYSGNLGRHLSRGISLDCACQLLCSELPSSTRGYETTAHLIRSRGDRRESALSRQSPHEHFHRGYFSQRHLRIRCCLDHGTGKAPMYSEQQRPGCSQYSIQLPQHSRTSRRGEIIHPASNGSLASAVCEIRPAESSVASVAPHGRAVRRRRWLPSDRRAA